MYGVYWTLQKHRVSPLLDVHRKMDKQHKKQTKWFKLQMVLMNEQKVVMC